MFLKKGKNKQKFFGKKFYSQKKRFFVLFVENVLNSNPALKLFAW